MIGLAEAAKGIYGAWRLARGDSAALGYFDATPEGFWRSFAAAVFVLPAYVGLVALAVAAYPGEVNLPAVMLVESIAYVIDWFAFPLAAVYICRWLGKENRYFLFIVALNWAKVPIAVVMLLTALAAAVVPGGMAVLLPIAVLAAVAAYVWHLTRVTLAAPAGEAAIVTAINFAIGIVTALWARSLLL